MINRDLNVRSRLILVPNFQIKKMDQLRLTQAHTQSTYFKVASMWYRKCVGNLSFYSFYLNQVTSFKKPCKHFQ